MSTSSSSKPARPSRWKNALKNLALFAAMFLLCGMVAEGVLRLMGYGNLEIYEPDPLLYWRLKPNQNCYTKVNHQPVRINAHRTRGAEFSTAEMNHFRDVIGALLEFQTRYGEAAREQFAETAVSKPIFRTLARGLRSRKIVVVNGVEGIGKSFSAEAWCEQHLGEARFVPA